MSSPPPKKPAPNDPLAAVSIATDPALPPPPKESSPAPPLEDYRKVVPPPPPPTSAGAKRLPYYRVLETKMVACRGQMLRIPAGSVISDESYGPGAMDALLEAGLKVEKVPPP